MTRSLRHFAQRQGLPRCPHAKQVAPTTSSGGNPLTTLNTRWKGPRPMTAATPRLPATEGRSSTMGDREQQPTFGRPMLLTSDAVPDSDRWTLELK